MKKIILGAVVLLLSTFILTGCQQEIDDIFAPTSTASGSMKAKIDGTQWVANKTTAADRSNGFISIAGSSTDNKTLIIRLIDSGAHRYTLTAETTNFASLLDSAITSQNSFTTLSDHYPDLGGEVNVTAIDTAKKTMTGTFTLKMSMEHNGDTLTRVLTEGSFTNISYAPAPNTSSNSFEVKINDTLFVPTSIMAIVLGAGAPIYITGSSSSQNRSVSLSIQPTIQPGTYELGNFFSDNAGIYTVNSNDMANSTQYMAENGTLEIISHNPSTRKISGKFKFNAKDFITSSTQVHVLTEGKFSVTYQ